MDKKFLEGRIRMHTDLLLCTETVSFVSEQNTNVKSVQVVIKTAAIETAAAATDTATEEAPLTFWQKLLRLFGLY